MPQIASCKEIGKGNNCALCVDPFNPKELAEAIEYLITHREETRRMGETGRRTVLEKYNWETEGKKMLALYGELAGS